MKKLISYSCMLCILSVLSSCTKEEDERFFNVLVYNYVEEEGRPLAFFESLKEAKPVSDFVVSASVMEGSYLTNDSRWVTVARRSNKKGKIEFPL